MTIGGRIAACWAVVAWTMLALGGRTGMFAAASVLIAAAMRPQVVRRNLPIMGSTAVFCLAIFFLSLLAGVPLAEAIDSALRLFCLVAVAPLAGGYADAFWFCRALARARVPRSVVLVLASTFAVLPMLIGDIKNFVYHHGQFSGTKRMASSMLAGVVVMTLDRVEELELADDAFDMTGLFTNSSGRMMAPYEFLYAVHIAALVVAWSW